MSRIPYTRMDGTRRPSVIALDVSFRDPEYSRFLREKPNMEWDEWRLAQQQKIKRGKSGGKSGAKSNAFGAPLALPGTPKLQPITGARHGGAYSKARSA